VSAAVIAAMFGLGSRALVLRPWLRLVVETSGQAARCRRCSSYLSG